ncbi:hypothetical protein MSPP1_002724 [Malassezia sp. CBS 17886]|nr:hypothetical protein MSPP1_002724 [Malassezia sp. CBS 17886]
MVHRVKFHFDCVSPFSYIAFNVMRRYRTQWNMEVEWCPLSLSYVMKYAANKAPMTNVHKGQYMMKELENVDKMFGVNFPGEFPFNTMSLMIFLFEVKKTRPDMVEGLAETATNAIWVRGKAITSLDDVRAVLAPCFAGQEDLFNSLLERSATPDARRGINEASKELVETRGAFGFPWMIVTRESDGKETDIFGADRMEYLAANLDQQYRGPFADGITPRL